MIEFFIPLKKVPTVTQQQHRITIRNGKPIVYDSPELKSARMLFISHLAEHTPEKMYTSSVRLITKWCFPITGKHHDGEYKYTRPDTDNLLKLFKDCMTDAKFWKDDALVVSEITEKFWSAIPGIYVRIEEIKNDK